MSDYLPNQLTFDFVNAVPYGVIEAAANAKPSFSPGDVLEISEECGGRYTLKLANLVHIEPMDRWLVVGYRPGHESEMVIAPMENVLERTGRWEERGSVPFRDLTVGFKEDEILAEATITTETTNRAITDFAKQKAEEFLWGQWEACQRNGQLLPRLREVTVAREKLIGRICGLCRDDRRELRKQGSEAPKVK